MHSSVEGTYFDKTSIKRFRLCKIGSEILFLLFLVEKIAININIRHLKFRRKNQKSPKVNNRKKAQLIVHFSLKLTFGPHFLEDVWNILA